MTSDAFFIDSGLRPFGDKIYDRICGTFDSTESADLALVQIDR